MPQAARLIASPVKPGKVTVVLVHTQLISGKPLPWAALPSDHLLYTDGCKETAGTARLGRGGSAVAMSQRASAAQQQVSVAASLQKHILFFLGVYSASPLTTHGRTRTDRKHYGFMTEIHRGFQVNLHIYPPNKLVQREEDQHQALETLSGLMMLCWVKL